MNHFNCTKQLFFSWISSCLPLHGQAHVRPGRAGPGAPRLRWGREPRPGPAPDSAPCGPCHAAAGGPARGSLRRDGGMTGGFPVSLTSPRSGSSASCPWRRHRCARPLSADRAPPRAPPRAYGTAARRARARPAPSPAPPAPRASVRERLLPAGGGTGPAPAALGCSRDRPASRNRLCSPQFGRWAAPKKCLSDAPNLIASFLVLWQPWKMSKWCPQSVVSLQPSCLSRGPRTSRQDCGHETWMIVKNKRVWKVLLGGKWDSSAKVGEWRGEGGDF